MDPVSKQLVIDDSEVGAVKIIFDMYLAGHSYSQIINKLNQGGYKTKTGKKFSNNSLYSILVNEKYTGTFIFNRSASAVNGVRNNHASKDEDKIIRIPGLIPAIITQEQFEKVKEMMSHKKRVGAEANSREVYLLTGLITCSKCGGPMTGNRKTAGRNKDIYYSYECSNRKRNKSCDAKSINRDLVENTVIEGLKKDIFSSEGINKLTQQINKKIEDRIKQQSREFERLQKELADLDKKINNAVQAIMNGLFSEALKAKLTAAEQQKAIICQTLNDIVTTEIKPITSDMIQLKIADDINKLNSGDKQQIKNVVQSYTSSIVVTPDAFNIDYIVTSIGGGGGS